MEYSPKLVALLIVIQIFMSITDAVATSPTVTASSTCSPQPSTSYPSWTPRSQKRGGFVARLIHHSSPKSPFYNASATKADLIRENFRVSALRGSHFSMKIAKAAISNEFSMHFGIGTPAIQTIGITDTGSILTWIQCSPCRSCFYQRAPMFYPMKSSTYKQLHCFSIECQSFEFFKCDGDKCLYKVEYADESKTSGVLSTESIYLQDPGQFGDNTTVDNFIFGCGDNNTDTVHTGNAGVVGLGYHSLSLIGRLNFASFSFCLTDDGIDGPEGFFHFGPSALLLGDRTPMGVRDEDGFYFISLESIMVEEEKIELPMVVLEEGMMVDTGSAVTRLHRRAFDLLVTSIKDNAFADPIPFEGFDICYGILADKPAIKLQFENYLFELSMENTWVLIPGKGLRCLGIVRLEYGASVLGMRQLRDMNVGFDLDKMQFTFKNTPDCPYDDREGE